MINKNFGNIFPKYDCYIKYNHYICKKCNMKRFNLKKAQAGNEVCTKNGLSVKILLFDRDSKIFPLVGIINNKKVCYYTIDGKFYIDKDSEFDLKMK